MDGDLWDKMINYEELLQKLQSEFPNAEFGQSDLDYCKPPYPSILYINFCFRKPRFLDVVISFYKDEIGVDINDDESDVMHGMFEYHGKPIFHNQDDVIGFIKSELLKFKEE